MNAADSYVTYSELDDARIVRIMLNRPEVRNAQNRGMIVELDQALLRAEEDDRVRVVILGGVGPVFSSGHDTGSVVREREQAPGPHQHRSYSIHGATRASAERHALQDWHYYFATTRRWRDLRKITIAEVHGTVYAAALMLAWACDLIVAAEGTTFADVAATRFGVCGVEYFAHPWEFGARKAKELLLTGDAIDADDAYRLGMVSKVLPRHTLAAGTETLARRIAAVPTMAALLVKESVNQTQDAMGFHNALNTCFNLHQLNHAHWIGWHDDRSPFGLPADGFEGAASAVVRRAARDEA